MFQRCEGFGEFWPGEPSTIGQHVNMGLRHLVFQFCENLEEILAQQGRLAAGDAQIARLGAPLVESLRD
jgi:hypothetical protein